MWKENRSVWFEAPKANGDGKGNPVDVGPTARALPHGVALAGAQPDPDAAAGLRAMEIALASDPQPLSTDELKARLDGLGKEGQIAAIKEAHEVTGTRINDLAATISDAEKKFNDLRNSDAGAKDLKLRMIAGNLPVLYRALDALKANYTYETAAVIAVGHPRNPEASFAGNVSTFLEYHKAIAQALEKANADLKQVISMNNEAAEKLQAQAGVARVAADT